MQGHRLRYAVALAAMFWGRGDAVPHAADHPRSDRRRYRAHPDRQLSTLARFLAEHRAKWGTELTLALVADRRGAGDRHIGDSS